MVEQNFLQARCHFFHQSNSVKALEGYYHIINMLHYILFTVKHILQTTAHAKAFK